MRSNNPKSIRISEKETLEWSTDSPADAKSARELDRLATWLDSIFEIPIIRLRFGIDALLGLLPGVGDTASTFASIYILQAAARLGISRVTLARMTINVLVDLLIGAIPFLGDVFDVYWKANRKNVELIRKHAEANPNTEKRLKRDDRLFVWGMIALILFVLIASLAFTYFVLAWVIRAFAGLAGSNF